MERGSDGERERWREGERERRRERSEGVRKRVAITKTIAKDFAGRNAEAISCNWQKISEAGTPKQYPAFGRKFLKRKDRGWDRGPIKRTTGSGIFNRLIKRRGGQHAPECFISFSVREGVNMLWIIHLQNYSILIYRNLAYLFTTYKNATCLHFSTISSGYSGSKSL